MKFIIGGIGTGKISLEEMLEGATIIKEEEKLE